MQKNLLYLLTTLLLVSGCNATEIKKERSQESTQAQQSTRDQKEEAPIVIFETNEGNITLKMYPKVAPLAVENFVTHAKNGYYDGLIFHRVIKDFMIQGGDPTGTGRGGESIWHKEFVNEYAPNVVFDKPFLLAMANHGPNTNGSQFFITTKETPWLNGGYTIFGEVIAGQEVVRKIENTKVAGPQKSRPVEEQKIIKAYVKQ